MSPAALENDPSTAETASRNASSCSMSWSAMTTSIGSSPGRSTATVASAMEAAVLRCIGSASTSALGSSPRTACPCHIGDHDDVERVDERREARRRTFQHGPSVGGGREGGRELAAAERLLAGPAVRQDHSGTSIESCPIQGPPARRRGRDDPGVPSRRGWGKMGDRSRNHERGGR